MKKILVTGGNGFIGKYVVNELLDRGYEPVVFDHHDRAEVELPDKVEYFIGDVRDEVALTEAMAHVDGFIHLAAVLGTQETISNPRPAALSNLMGGLNILEAAAQYKIPGVYIAVGNWWMNNPYSITKNMIERFVHMYNNDRGTSVNIVRAVNAYGPGQSVAAPYGSARVRKITPSFIVRALSNKPIEIYGDGKQVSDMVFVGDVAHALVNALEAADENFVFTKAIEIGPSEHKTVSEVANMITDIVNEITEHACPNHKFLPMRPGEVKGDKVMADNTTLKLIMMDERDLVKLEDGLRATVEYYINSEGEAWSKPEDL